LNANKSIAFKKYPLNPSNNQRLITAIPVSTPSAEISEPVILLIAGLGITLLSIRRGTGTQPATRV